MMVRIILTSAVLLFMGHSAFAQSAFAQSAELEQPLLTTDLLRRIDPRDGTDKLSETDVLKLLPIACKMAPAPADSENDWVITAAETTEFVIEFTEGKVSSRSATFHPAAKSRQLTLERFRELREGMTMKEVETLFGEELSHAPSFPSDNGKHQIERCRYVRGRELEAYIAKGKLTGALLKAYLDK